MSEDKFTSEYYEQNYHIFKSTVYRNEDSSGCNAKEDCLRGCFTHFTKQDFKNVRKISDHFTTNRKEIREGAITRCCCSQNEDSGITHVIVTHKVSNISFIVGKDCFYKLFSEADDADTFFKEQCKWCGAIVAKRNSSRENFCNKECVRNYENAERKKRSQKVYLKCVECNVPKKIPNQQKYMLCYKCDQEKKLDDMLRTPDGEIHGWADSSDDETELFIGSLSIS